MVINEDVGSDEIMMPFSSFAWPVVCTYILNPTAQHIVICYSLFCFCFLLIIIFNII